MDGMQALVAGLGCGACSGNGQDWLASQVFQDCPCVWVVVGSCAGFPGGLAVSWYFLVPRWCLCPCPVAPAMHACWPLLATAGLSSLFCACDCLCSLLLAGNELASLYVGVIPWPLMAGGVPGWSSALGALKKGVRWGALHV